MNTREAISRIRTVEVVSTAPLVCRTVAEALAGLTGASIEYVDRPGATRQGVFRVGVGIGARGSEPRPGPAQPEVRFVLEPDGSGSLAASHPQFLFNAAHVLLLEPRDVQRSAPGTAPGTQHLAPSTAPSTPHPAPSTGLSVTYSPAFAWNRSCYDIFLTQEARIQHGLDPATYVRRLAESGFTHAEVNALASPMGIETGPKGEVYPMFYTYCPALDQFVHSRLNEGLYPYYYLSSNLAVLKRNAALARKYGLVPGLLCFEPRSVPEEFFARYPMLRGARVDHPFRSFKPRYTMTLAHPAVREHYAEMVRKLLHEVPDLGHLVVWTNDSGSGFEHTRSLYVGRNGGPYMIREWKDHEEIARVAGEHALVFFRTLRDAGRSVNPDFRVITRLESFMGEHETIWNGLGDGVEVETTSLVARGWDMPYAHPRYPDSRAINSGSVHQLEFADREKTLMADLAARGSTAHFYTAVGPHQLFAPLLGVPYPALACRRLRLLHEAGVRTLSQVGGACPPEIVPFDVNHELMARFQLDPGIDVDAEIQDLAERWAGPDRAEALVEAWRAAEEAILAFPNVCPLYSTIGFTWYRLWARPLVPNIEAIPAEERAYYQAFMCTTPHNPNNVDLGRDVLFRLIAPEQARKDVERIDRNVWPPLNDAIGRLEAVDQAGVVRDQLVRLKALRCWIETQRNVAAWVASVYGWMESAAPDQRAGHRATLDELVKREIANSRALLGLLASGVEFMATTDLGETPLLHGRNLTDLLARRIALMERHAGDDPFIDHDYMMRMAAKALG